jgi:hypothetical protein
VIAPLDSSQMTVTGGDKGKQRARTPRSLSREPPLPSGSTTVPPATPPGSQRGDLADLFASLVLSGRPFAFHLDVQGEPVDRAIESDGEEESISSSRRRAPRGRSSTPIASASSSSGTADVSTTQPGPSTAMPPVPGTDAVPATQGPVGAILFTARPVFHPGQLAGFHAVQREYEFFFRGP